MVMNVTLITNLARQLNIEMPRNIDLKSKNFLRLSKEKMYLRLFGTLNQANGVQLEFKRERF
jgi:hypothetical protein